MENSKTIVSEEKRISKSKQVWIQFSESDGKIDKFNVLDEQGNIKYFGQIESQEPKESDKCSCPSYTYGMRYDKIGEDYKGESDYLREHGYSFQCKHIIKARLQRYEVPNVS